MFGAHTLYLTALFCCWSKRLGPLVYELFLPLPAARFKHALLNTGISLLPIQVFLKILLNIIFLLSQKKKKNVQWEQHEEGRQQKHCRDRSIADEIWKAQVWGLGRMLWKSKIKIKPLSSWWSFTLFLLFSLLIYCSWKQTWVSSQPVLLGIYVAMEKDKSSNDAEKPKS